MTSEDTVFVMTVWTQTVSEGVTLADGCIDLVAEIPSVEGVGDTVLGVGVPLVTGGHLSLPATPVAHLGSAERKIKSISCKSSLVLCLLWQGSGEQGWRSSDSARLPPVCPGFDSRTRRHNGAEFVGCLRGVSPGTPVFSSPQKTTFV